MQAAPPLHPAQEPPAPQAARPPQIPQAAPHADLWDFAEECLRQTAAIVHETRSATDLEIQHAINRARESHAQGRPCDLLETIARVQGHEEEHLGRVIVELGNKVAQAVNPHPPLIPFGGKLIAPSAFYDSFDHIHKIARVLLSPVIYAEDTDAIGTASANPVAPAILAREIASTVFKRFGISPFVTIARLDYESWTFLSRKHFEL